LEVIVKMASEIVININLLEFSFQELGRILRTEGLPLRIVNKTYHLYSLYENGHKPIESKEWIVPTSPRTKKRVIDISKRDLANRFLE